MIIYLNLNIKKKGSLSIQNDSKHKYDFNLDDLNKD